MHRPTAPPLLPGTLTPTLWDHLRIVWWHEQGFIRGCSRGIWRERVRSVTLALLWWPSLGAVLAVQLWRSTRPNRTEYLSPTRDAVLTIVAKSDGVWVIEDHVRRQPLANATDGRRKDPDSGKGGQLRHLIAAPLLAYADAHGIVIEATAATEKLARLYMTELAGMETTATTPSGRIQLRRLPQPASGVAVPTSS